jgi:hypothetical protein
MKRLLIFGAVLLTALCSKAGDIEQLNRPGIATVYWTDCSKMKEFADDRDKGAIMEMCESDSVILLDQGTVISVDEILADGIDRIHVQGRSQTLYIIHDWLVKFIAPPATTTEAPAAASTPTEAPAAASTIVPPLTNVVSAITGNRWTPDALIVSGTLTNTSRAAVLITGINAKGFNQDQKMVSEGSDFTIARNNLAPGEVVNFKVALRDGTKQVKFVKVVPAWSP